MALERGGGRDYRGKPRARSICPRLIFRDLVIRRGNEDVSERRARTIFTRSRDTWSADEIPLAQGSAQTREAVPQGEGERHPGARV